MWLYSIGFVERGLGSRGEEGDGVSTGGDAEYDGYRRLYFVVVWLVRLSELTLHRGVSIIDLLTEPGIFFLE